MNVIWIACDTWRQDHIRTSFGGFGFRRGTQICTSPSRTLATRRALVIIWDKIPEF